MEIHNAKRQLELQKILPLGQSWCTSEATWLADFLPNVHRFKRFLRKHMQLVISSVVNRPLKYVELLANVKCIVATTDAFLKWKAGQTKGMIGRTVAKVAARSEGVLLDDVEALDVLPAVAALNEHFKTCIFVGDENQKFQRRGARSPRPFALAIGTAHGAASQVLSQCDDVVVIEETNKAYIPRERGISDWFDKDNDNIENLSRLTLCKRCGPAITSFLSALAPMRPQLADFKSSDMAPATKLDHIMYCGSGWLTWEQLRDDLSFARRARDLLERPSLDTNLSSAHFKQQVVWHDVLFRALLVHVEWDLKHEMQEGERMLIICFLRRVSEPVAALLAAFLSEGQLEGIQADSNDQLEGIQADPNRLYVAYTRGRLATTVWMEQEPLGLPSDA